MLCPLASSTAGSPRIKAVLEMFWWNCLARELSLRLVYLSAKLAPRVAALGFDRIWTPRPSKNTDVHNNNMGYTPYYYYDIMPFQGLFISSPSEAFLRKGS